MGVRARPIVVAGCALLVGFVLVLFRGEPIPNGDQGVFLSIAARMLAGDHLYSEVVDNKDPLFFYTYAGALWVGGWRAPAALDGVWFAVAALSFGLLLRELQAPRPAVLAGFLLYPLSLSVGWYSPGLSMLAGLAIAPFVGWLWLSKRFTASGAVFAATILFKLSIAFVVVAPIAAFLLFGVPGGSRFRQIARATLGGSVVIGAAAAILAARGELRGYIDVLVYNFTYSNDGLYYVDQDVDGRGTGGVLGHVRVVYEALGKWEAGAAVIVLAVFLVAVYHVRNREGRAFRLLAGAAIASVIATLGTLALTALWRHHVQMLAFPLVLVAAVLVAVAMSYGGRRLGVLAAGVCIFSLFLSSARAEVRNGVSVGAWFADAQSVTATALETARRRYYDGVERVTYMHFGQNTENAHAAFINDAFALACPRFHQYPHDPSAELTDTLECVKRERPMLVFVTPSLFDPSPAPQWKPFVVGAQHLLTSRYEMVSDTDGVEVWKRSATPVDG